MKDQILRIISSFVDIPMEELEKSIDTEGVWDSLQKVEIIIEVENEFDISFTQDEIAEINTISQIINKIQGKM